MGKKNSSRWLNLVTQDHPKVPLNMAKKMANGDHVAIIAGWTHKQLQIATQYLFYTTSQLQADKRTFSTIDLRRAFHHIPVTEKDIANTAVITLLGLYEFVGMPFELRSTVLSSTIFFPTLISPTHTSTTSSFNERQHEQHLRLIFERLLRSWIENIHGRHKFLKTSP